MYVMRGGEVRTAQGQKCLFVPPWLQDLTHQELKERRKGAVVTRIWAVVTC